MARIIGYEQSSFLPGRQTRDNIARELMHTMRQKKRKQGFMMLKIDLEKAYDMLSWSFIEDTMNLVGIPQNFVKLVMYCVTTPEIRLIWNNEVSEAFKPSRVSIRGIQFHRIFLCIVWKD